MLFHDCKDTFHGISFINSPHSVGGINFQFKSSFANISKLICKIKYFCRNAQTIFIKLAIYLNSYSFFLPYFWFISICDTDVVYINTEKKFAQERETMVRRIEDNVGGGQ